MPDTQKPKIGFVCAYTPLPLIEAADCAPYRVLPTGEWPDQAGRILHDNLCPHVKRIVDRALAGDLPDLTGIVFMNSCDAMRRAADAWRKIRPEHNVVLVDLPSTVDEASIDYFAGELSRFTQVLAAWTGRTVGEGEISTAISTYNKLANGLENVRERVISGTLQGGSGQYQELINQVSVQSARDSFSQVNELVNTDHITQPANDGVPIYLFGNVLADAEAFTLLEECGARVVGEDLCTGSRFIHPIEDNEEGDVFRRLARGILMRPRCARTVQPSNPGQIAQDVIAGAKACGASGVICHNLKFCDPYIARLPAIREALREAAIPLLVLEGDCTLRSIGQQRTRIEAFIEMLR